MSPQRTDDPSRNLREVWLGPNGAWRWPFDATFREWAVGCALSVVAFVVLWLVLPLGVLALVLAWLWSGILARHVGSGIRFIRGGYFALVLVTLLLLFPRPAQWLRPMPLWMAALGAIAVAFYLVKRLAPFLDGNRPLRYWWAVLRSVASGPRAQRPPATYAAGVPFPVEGGYVVFDEVHEWITGQKAHDRFMLNVAAVEEEDVPKYTNRTEYEAMVWNPRTGREENSTRVIAWLTRHGVDHEVINVRYKTSGGAHEMLLGADLRINRGTSAHPDYIDVRNDRTIVLDVRNPNPSKRVTIWQRRDFAENFAPVVGTSGNFPNKGGSA